MKKTYIGYSVLATVLALSTQQAKAQQGFGTNQPSKASAIEMLSNNKGLLIPRVALTNLNSFAPVSGEAPTDVAKTDALLVYNTATSDAAVAEEEKVTPGYYYWTTDGTTGKWNRIATGADAKAEPWFVQGTTNQAEENDDDIYIMGTVAIGTNETEKTGLEVVGDFKAEVIAGTNDNISYGKEIDHPLLTSLGAAQNTVSYWIDLDPGELNYRIVNTSSTNAAMQSGSMLPTGNTSIVSTNGGEHATMASYLNNNASKSEIRTTNTGNFFMETYNVANNYGSTISLQNDGLRLVHSETNGAGDFLADENRSEILVQKEDGVRFNFRDEDGDVKGEYWFPTTTGAAGHVLTRVGGNQTDWVSTRDMVAMPKFFYMPSIIVPTSEEQLDAPGSGKTASDWFSDATGQGGIDLHARYTAQFNAPMVTNPTQTTTLPTLTATQLDYNITWYDINVFSAVAVSNTGIMTYTLAPGADVTVGSFMNIVFSVK